MWRVLGGHQVLKYFLASPTLGLLPNTFKLFLTEVTLKSSDSIYWVTHKTQTSKSLLWALKTHDDLIWIYFSRHFYLPLLQKGYTPVKWTPLLFPECLALFPLVPIKIIPSIQGLRQRPKTASASLGVSHTARSMISFPYSESWQQLHMATISDHLLLYQWKHVNVHICVCVYLYR